MPGAELQADLWVNEYITPHDIYSHGIERVLWSRRTEFQDAMVVRSGLYGTALVLDGKWQSCTGDEFVYHEPLVQPACVSLAAAGHAPRTALILGGGEGATSREVLRWASIERCTMVDIDGPVVDACREHLAEMHRGAFDDPRHDLVIDDALEYVKDDSKTPGGPRAVGGGWDLIVSDLSDPIEDGPSFPLFTREYFQGLRRVLAEKGVLVVQAGPVAPHGLPTHAKLAATLRDVFAHTRSMVTVTNSYGAPWSYILASDEPLQINLEPAAVDAILGEHTSDPSELRFFDGVALRFLANPPKHVRAAVAVETEVFTMERPPKFFGTGVATA
ncbi:MAG: spermidine synthase [Planctomycetota bacterium]